MSSIWVEPISLPRQLITIDADTLKALNNAFDEREEMAGFTSPETKTSLAPFEAAVEAGIQKIGAPCVPTLLSETPLGTPTQNDSQPQPRTPHRSL